MEGFVNELALVNVGTNQVGGEQPEFPSRGKCEERSRRRNETSVHLSP